MRKLSTLALLSLFCLFISCGGGKDKEKTETTTQDNMTTGSQESNPTDHTTTTTTTGTSRYEQRRAKGDTLAMPYKDLQAYLPEVGGYTKDGGPKGSQMNMPGMGSWSETSQDYTSGDKRLSVKIVDYNAAFGTLQGLTSVYSMGFTAEDDNRKQAPADLGVKDVAAYQTTYKTEKRSEITVIVADRFFVTVESNGEEGEAFVQNVAKSLKLGELASK